MKTVVAQHAPKI